jgi:hypothetical protein
MSPIGKRFELSIPIYEPEKRQKDMGIGTEAKPRPRNSLEESGRGMGNKSS